MRYRELGRTGLKVSEIGFGALAIGGRFGPTEDRQSIEALKKAFDLGVNFYDTADAYGFGKSEKLIGAAFKGRTDDIVIATKVGNDFYSGKGRRKFDPDYIRFALGKSLERLGVKTIDLYQLHSPSMSDISAPGVFQSLEELKGEGKIRHYGVAIHPLEVGFYAMEKARPASIQVVYNILERDAEGELLPKTKANGVGILARVPLAFGMLTGKFTAETTFHPEDHRSWLWAREHFARGLEYVAQLRFLIDEETPTLAQAALKFILSNPEVSTVIPGAKTPQQVEDNVAASDGKYLSKEKLERLRELYSSLGAWVSTPPERFDPARYK